MMSPACLSAEALAEGHRLNSDDSAAEAYCTAANAQLCELSIYADGTSAFDCLLFDPQASID